ncbi:spectrin binding [Trichomonas vaginalis G3]|nr:spectrin binding [Trichomonas vaginalis G3]KAI5516080.1 spectrin binding [Trichomonas vaginalis G3]
MTALRCKNQFAIDLLIDKPESPLKGRDARGRTLLHYIAEYGEPILIVKYFQKSLNANANEWKNGGTPIHNAAYGPVENFIAQLKPFGIPDPMKTEAEAQAEAEDEAAAAEEKDPPDPIILIHAMMDANFDTMQSAIHGEIPLQLAAASGSEMKVRLLMGFYSKVYHQDNCGLTALHYAVREDKPKVAEFLLRYGADANERDFDGNAPIHYAAMKNSVESIKVLVEKNANLNAKNAQGKTALHFAAELGHLEVVNELLAKGADPNVRDINGWAALRLAIKERHDEIAQVLTEHGTRPY